VSGDDVGPGVLDELAGHAGEAPWQKEVVCIQETENFAGRESEALVQGIRRPSIVLADPVRQPRRVLPDRPMLPSVERPSTTIS
jgi:hypothetical protein